MKVDRIAISVLAILVAIGFVRLGELERWVGRQRQRAERSVEWSEHWARHRAAV